MKKYTLIISALLLLDCILQAQNYIGMDKDQIIEAMKVNKPDFERQKVINDSYNYLKYQDSYGEQTILFFLSKNDVCTSVKLMSHYVHLGKELTDLNARYESLGNNKWKFTENGITYTVELQKGQWFFSIITKKME